MGTTELRKRDNWQTLSGDKALSAEKDFFKVFREAFEGTVFVLHEQPKHLKDLYATVVLPQQTLEQIYNPDIDISKKAWGVKPDFAIENTDNNKIIFGEIKRQDGWVEEKLPNAGRGNAHERSCKMFTPGLLKAYREKGNLGDDVLPFWIVFQGDITRDPKRVREITFWFDEYQDHFFMWRDSMTDQDLIDHFDLKLKKHLL